jgi:hypothetical protein
MENKPECVGCKSYYLYYSGKGRKYIITEHALEAFDNSPWINLEDRCIPDLIKLLQNHESLLQKNKANLSAKEAKTVNFKDYKSKEMREAEERFYHLSDHLFSDNSKKDPNPKDNA